jgi:hypothetical protein
MTLETVQNYCALWTGVGAQLAQAVPFCDICWSSLDNVSLCLYTLDVFIIFNFIPCTRVGLP